MTEWLAVITITIFAVISPGPDFAMVTRNALSLSRRAGILTAVGIGLGVLVHVSYTLLGVGVLMRDTPALFAVLKLIGAGYLIWLGLRLIVTRPAHAQPASPQRAPGDFAALRMGFLTNALNPKTTIFILSLFLQVVRPQTPLATCIAYGMFISGAHIVWFSAVGVFFGSAVLQQRIFRVRHWIDRCFGAVLVGFGVALAVANLGG